MVHVLFLQWFSLPLQAILQEHCNHNVVNNSILVGFCYVLVTSHCYGLQKQTVTGFWFFLVLVFFCGNFKTAKLVDLIAVVA